jgi:hypothetical protein
MQKYVEKDVPMAKITRAHDGAPASQPACQSSALPDHYD